MSKSTKEIKLIFLSSEFYSDYPKRNYSEILIKHDRPYIMFKVTIDDIDFAIPFRSNIPHKNAFFTDEKNKCGIDYSKSIVIKKPIYINISEQPTIRANEFKIFKSKDYIIKNEFKKYLKEYKKAAKKQDVKRNKDFCQFSSLQYFHSDIGL
ncbi:hypothetical protein CHF27_008950 [Romboutsia maritimum]|uniref:Type III toxin-antitoxin system ToxN/AbiQ family toxin n=1 Tax=Romboutsia maritimum TaxID=2020948 RepID=A0A371IS07_9FIRM|nr:hypothetical protein [Romboutsia maritimum]RDY23262.1 hypothetical protein CHF27_008950 [Romboutsia maritimum]